MQLEALAGVASARRAEVSWQTCQAQNKSAVSGKCKLCDGSCDVLQLHEVLDLLAVPGDHICSKCWVIEELGLKVDNLESELLLQRHIREGQNYLDLYFWRQSHL